MPSGGDLREATWKNDDVGQGRYLSKAGESHMLDKGGYLTEDDAQNIDTGGNFINIKTTKPWTYEATIVVDQRQNNRKEIDTAQALSDSFLPTTWTFQCIDNTTWAGTGSVVGEIKMDASKATMSFKVMGGGQLVQIG